MSHARSSLPAQASLLHGARGVTHASPAQACDNEAMEHRTTITLAGDAVTTLADVLPEAGPLRMLVVGKTPSPASVEAGHHLQGGEARLFWSRLEEHGILPSGAGRPCDDLLIEHGFGITDIAKRPRALGQEPTADEYRQGWQGVEEIIDRLRPRIVTFVYKSSLDRVLRLHFGWQHTSHYGFNHDLMRTFGRRVFVFPLPGVPCPPHEAQRAMEDLCQALAND